MSEHAVEYNPGANIVVKIVRASDRPKYWWSVAVDDVEHGGGYADTESVALVDAANYVRDIGR